MLCFLYLVCTVLRVLELEGIQLGILEQAVGIMGLAHLF